MSSYKKDSARLIKELGESFLFSVSQTVFWCGKWDTVRNLGVCDTQFCQGFKEWFDIGIFWKVLFDINGEFIAVITK